MGNPVVGCPGTENCGLKLPKLLPGPPNDVNAAPWNPVGNWGMFWAANKSPELVGNEGK